MHTTTPPRPPGPLQISEIILRTSRFDALKNWYQVFFGGLRPNLETDTGGRMKSVPHIERLCFLRIHAAFPYTQVLGIFEVPGADVAPRMHAGLDHMQFRERSLADLFARYAMLKDQGVTPTHCFNHGPSSSFYYRDPDGNTVELSAVNFATEQEYLAFFGSDAFRQNVEGHPIDPEQFIAQRTTADALPTPAALEGP